MIASCNCLRCQSDLYTHEPIPRILQLGQHDSLLLAKHAVASFQTTNLRFSQLHALHSWKLLQHEMIDYRTRSPAEYRCLLRSKVVQSAANIFNAVFFLDALPANILEVRWSKFGPGVREQGRADLVDDTVVISMVHIRISDRL